MNNEIKTDNKTIALKSIDYVQRLLNRFKRVLTSNDSDNFTTLELTDLINILGLETYELKELLNLTASRINQIEKLLD